MLCLTSLIVCGTGECVVVRVSSLTVCRVCVIVEAVLGGGSGMTGVVKDRL